jgi:hypothetical protein
MKAKVKAGQEEVKATINFIWSELEGTIKNRVENALQSVDQ